LPRIVVLLLFAGAGGGVFDAPRVEISFLLPLG